MFLQRVLGRMDGGKVEASWVEVCRVLLVFLNPSTLITSLVFRFFIVVARSGYRLRVLLIYELLTPSKMEHQRKGLNGFHRGMDSTDVKGNISVKQTVLSLSFLPVAEKSYLPVINFNPAFLILSTTTPTISTVVNDPEGDVLFVDR